MVVIRLARGGRKKRPFYHIVVVHKSRARDGKFIERLGFYNPVAQGNAETLRFDLERLEAWLAKGAKMSDTVSDLAKKAKKGQVEATAA